MKKLSAATKLKSIITQCGELFTSSPETDEKFVLWCALSDFSQLSESTDKKVMIRFLADYLEGVTSIVARHGGAIGRLNRGGFAAAWDVPDKACRAAQELLHFVRVNEEFYALKYGVKAKVEIGIGENKITAAGLRETACRLGVGAIVAQGVLDTIRAMNATAPSTRPLDTSTINGVELLPEAPAPAFEDVE